MFLIIDALQAIGLVLGSLVLACLLCWLASTLAGRMHHDNWAAVIVLALSTIFVLSGLTHSQFIKLSTVYCVFGAIFLYITTRSRIAQRPLRRGGK